MIEFLIGLGMGNGTMMAVEILVGKIK